MFEFQFYELDLKQPFKSKLFQELEFMLNNYDFLLEQLRKRAIY